MAGVIFALVAMVVACGCTDLSSRTPGPQEEILTRETISLIDGEYVGRGVDLPDADATLIDQLGALCMSKRDADGNRSILKITATPEDVRLEVTNGGRTFVERYAYDLVEGELQLRKHFFKSSWVVIWVYGTRDFGLIKKKDGGLVLRNAWGALGVFIVIPILGVNSPHGGHSTELERLDSSRR